jgi:gas vesicle protein
MEENTIGESIVRLEEQMKNQTSLMLAIQKSLDEMKTNYDGTLKEIRCKIEDRIKESDKNQSKLKDDIVELQNKWRTAVAIITVASIVLQFALDYAR